MRYIATAFLAVMLVTSATAQDVRLDEQEMDQAQDFMNRFSEDLPGFLQSVLGDQRINANIEDGNETVVYSAETEGMTVQNLSDERLEDPTLVVNTSVSTIEDVYESNDTAEEVRQKFNEGEITYESRGLINQIMTFVMELFI